MNETKTILMLLIVGILITLIYYIYNSVINHKKEEQEKEELRLKLEHEKKLAIERKEQSVKWNNIIQEKFDNKVKYKTNIPIKVLVGDYVLGMATLTNSLLRSMGIETEIVPMASDVVDRVVEGNKYDIIITNNVYPNGESGQKILDTLKENKDFKTPIIILTVDQDARSDYLKDGFDEYIPKPIDKDKVQDIFPKLIDGLKFTKIKSNKSTN